MSTPARIRDVSYRSFLFFFGIQAPADSFFHKVLYFVEVAQMKGVPFPNLHY